MFPIVLKKQHKTSWAPNQDILEYKTRHIIIQNGTSALKRISEKGTFLGTQSYLFVLTKYFPRKNISSKLSVK